MKISNTVRLKSGGPLMTVINIIQNALGPNVECQWFDNQGSKKSDWFIEAVLMDEDIPENART